MAQRAASGDLDREAFLAAVAIRLGNGSADFAEAAQQATAKRELEPTFASEALLIGLVEVARRELGTKPRTDAIRSVRLARRTSVGESRTVTVSVIPSQLREWPVMTVNGFRRMEECTVEDVEHQASHFRGVIQGLNERLAVLDAVMAAAVEAQVERIGDLDDDTLNACLMAGQG